MKTMMLRKEIRCYDPNEMAKLLRATGLPARGLMRHDELDAVLINLGRNPDWSDLFTALGVTIDFVKPKECPTFRFALMDDLFLLWTQSTLQKFIHDSHLLDSPSDLRGVTYNLFRVRYAAIEKRWLSLKYNEFDYHMEKIRNLVATGYYMSQDEHDKYGTREVWARDLLEPIMSTQLLIYGPNGNKLTHKTVEDDTYVESVAFFASLMDPEYFQRVGKEIFRRTTHEFMDHRFNEISTPLPARIPYTVFARVIPQSSRLYDKTTGTLLDISETSKADVKRYSVVQANEVKDIPHLEQQWCDMLNEMHVRATEDMLRDKRYVLYSINGNVMIPVHRAIPQIIFDIPYAFLMLAALVDMVEVKEKDGSEVDVVFTSPLMKDLVNTTCALMANPDSKKYSGESMLTPVLDSDTDITKDDTPSVPFEQYTEPIRMNMKKLMMFAADYSTKTDELTKNETIVLTAIGVWINGLVTWAVNNVHANESIYIPCVVNSELPNFVKTAIGLKTDRPSYRILLDKSRSYRYDRADILPETSLAFDTTNCGLIQSLFDAAVMCFSLNTADPEHSAVEFPRSSMWRGDSMYLTTDFIRMPGCSSRADAMEHMSKVGPLTKRYFVETKLNVNTAIRMVPDYHLKTVIASKTLALVTMYSMIKDHEIRKLFRRALLKRFIQLGADVRHPIGILKSVSKSTRAQTYYNSVQDYAYFMWYADLITGSDYERSLGLIYQETEYKDFEWYVDGVTMQH